MTIIEPESGILNIDAILQQHGKDILTQEYAYRFKGQKIIAAANIESKKVIALAGYNETFKIPEGLKLNNINQTILGVSNSSALLGEELELITQGIIQTYLNGTGKNIGDLIYSDEFGELTFIPTSPLQKAIGSLATTTTNAFILLNIKVYNPDDIFSLESITQNADDNSENIATTAFTQEFILKNYYNNFWVEREVPANVWRSIIYGNNLFVAVGDAGAIMTSPDGINWTSGANIAGEWKSITYGNGLFVAVASNGANKIMTSPDGVTWTTRTPPSPDDSTWKSVVYGNALFVAVADSGTHRVMTSPDGITWTARTAAQVNQWQSVAFGKGTFVAVADSGTNRVMTSTNGITWVSSPVLLNNYLFTSITYGNGSFVACSNNGTSIMSSTNNGNTWTFYVLPNSTESQISISYGNNLFVLTSGTTSYKILTSSDGINWRQSFVSNEIALTGSAYSNTNKLFVAVGLFKAMTTYLV